jgi:hypothetical protein
MRKTILSAAIAASMLTGCSKRESPVVLTPEMEAEQKEAVDAANQAESTRQKTGKTGRALTGAEQEALRAKK